MWLVRDGRDDIPLLRLKGRIVDLAVSKGRRPLVAMALDGATGRAVVVARLTAASGRTKPTLRIVGGGVEPHRRPWRVAWGDVDGDGRDELLVGVVGRARFDPTERRRPFVYAWDGRRLIPKWLGSRLSRPFVDLALGDVDRTGPSDLVALESTRDGGLEVAVYGWKGFGFERRFSSSRITAPALLKRSSENRILLEADSRRYVVSIDENRLSITPTELP